MTDVALPARIGAAAVQLRVSGASYADIAETLGVSDSRMAMKLVADELAAQGNSDPDARERLRDECDASLMSLLPGVMARAQNPEDPEHLQSVKTAVTLIDRRIKLHGLDAPTEITVHTPTQTELDQWVAAMASRSMPMAALEEPDIVDAEIVE